MACATFYSLEMNDNQSQMTRTAPKRIILWGGTGQAKVMRPVVETTGRKVVAIFDDTAGLVPPFPDVPLYCGWEAFRTWIGDQRRDEIGFCVTIGNPHGRVRLRLHERLSNEGLQPVTAVHPTAWISPSAQIDAGVQIHAGAIVEAHAKIGSQCIINTKASVDHECVLEQGVELAPAATLCGLVYLGVNAWVCAGATVLPRLRIGADSIVGAGAVVIRDVPKNVTVVGVPAQILRKNRRK